VLAWSSSDKERSWLVFCTDFVPSILGSPFVQVELDWHFSETELISKYAQQVAAVLGGKELRIIALDDNRWRLRTDLRGVKDLR
jgi:hypothetical protein